MATYTTFTVSLPAAEGFAHQTVQVEVDPNDGEIRVDDSTRRRLSNRDARVSDSARRAIVEAARAEVPRDGAQLYFSHEGP